MIERVVLVTGGRSFADVRAVDRALSPLHPRLVIEGGAQGADRLCRAWARRHGIHVATVEALWDYWRDMGKPKAAGIIRNGVLVELARATGAVVVAFPGNSGTADCVLAARAAGLEVIEVPP